MANRRYRPRILVAAALAGLAGSGAYLEPGVEGRPVRRPPTTVRRVPPPDDAGRALRRWLDGLDVGDPLRRGRLVVYPLRTRRQADRGYLALDEGIRRGVVVVTEVNAGGTVSRVRVENRSHRHLLLVAGEILVGGKQDRVVQHDLLVAPSSRVPIDVFCVEQGRWRGDTSSFGSSGLSAPPATRQSLARGDTQEGVWAQVAEIQSGLSVESSSGALRRIYEDPESAEEIDASVRGLVLPRRANGMIVVGNDRVLGLDLFAGPRTFEKYREKLLKAYAAQALAVKHPRAPARRWNVRWLVDRIRNARLTARPTPGIGENLRLAATEVDGEFLRHPGAGDAYGAVHLSAFPRHDVTYFRDLERPAPYEGRMAPRGR